jgi:hypothetical protein
MMKMKAKAILYLAIPLFLGAIIAYMSVYSLHPLDPNDWYRYGFPIGWKNTEATGEGYDTPIFTFYNPTGFVLDVLFWYSIILFITGAVMHTASRKTRAS